MKAILVVVRKLQLLKQNHEQTTTICLKFKVKKNSLVLSLDPVRKIQAAVVIVVVA